MYYCTRTVDSKILPNGRVKVITIPRTSIIFPTGKKENDFSEVIYYNMAGWIPTRYIEENDWEDTNVVEIEENLANKNLHTAKQYISWEQKVKKNLCGEFCVSYMAKTPIGSFLNTWREKDFRNYNLIVPNDRTTGLPSLESMLKSVDLTDYTYWNKMLTNEYGEYTCTPKVLSDVLLNGYKAIIGLKIDSSGRMNNPLGVTGHWCVLSEVYQTHSYYGGFCSVYNPFWNTNETLSFSELMATMTKFGSPTGIFVKC
jgi:hypothetical protein